VAPVLNHTTDRYITLLNAYTWPGLQRQSSTSYNEY